MSSASFRWGLVGPLVVVGLVVQGAFRLFVRPGAQQDLARVEAEVRALAAQPSHGGTGPADEFAARTADAGIEVGAELIRTRESVASLAGVLGPAGGGDSVLRSLGELASDAGVRFRRFAPEPEYRLNGYRARAVTVSAEGAYFDLVRFFERVSRLPELVLIEDFELEPGPEDLTECRFVAVLVRRAEGAGDVEAGQPEPGSPALGEGRDTGEGA